MVPTQKWKIHMFFDSTRRAESNGVTFRARKALYDLKNHKKNLKKFFGLPFSFVIFKFWRYVFALNLLTNYYRIKNAEQDCLMHQQFPRGYHIGNIS